MITVVIPAFNAGASLSRAIDSVLAQSYRDIEIIVVDDGSTDNTRSVVSNYGDKVTYVYQDNAGPGASRNAGIGLAKGEWIAFLDSDDEWHHADKLSLQMDLLKRNPELRWCGANAYNVNGPRKTYRSDYGKAKAALGSKDYFDNYFSAVGEGHIWEATITFVIRRDVFDEVGLFSTELLRAEDSDMWARIAFRYPKFGYIPEALATFHLDVSNPILTERRLFAKRGVYFRIMLDRLIPLAIENDCLDAFRPYIFWILKHSLLHTVYHGHAQDVRETITKYRDFIPWYWRYGAYLGSILPKQTSYLAHGAAYAWHLVRMEKTVTRRWTHKRDL